VGCLMGKYKFTIQEEKEICKKYIAGKTSPKIAKEVNCDCVTVCNILHRNKIKMRPSGTFIVFLKDQEQEIIKKYKEGKSIKEIGNDYNVTHEVITRFLKSHNIVIIRGDTTKLKNKKVRQCCDCGDIYPLDMFCKDKGACMGRSYHCKFCHDEEGYKRRYGLSMKDVLLIEKKQNGLCAICGRAEEQIRNGKIIRLSIDHNNETGKIREMLCSKCNQLLGMFDENISVIESAIKYLNKNGFERSFILCSDIKNNILDCYSFTVPKEGTLYQHGITLDQYRYMYSEQGGTCAICNRAAFDNRFGILTIDHDHTYGKRDPDGIRGLLCNFCNSAIGLAREDSNILQSAINYLKKHGVVKKKNISHGIKIRTDDGPYNPVITFGWNNE